MIVSEFNHQTGFLDSKFEGEVTLKQIVDYIEATENNKSFPRTLKILTDSTKAVMNMAAKDLMVIVEANGKSVEKYDFIIDAIVTDSPKETALSLLYQELAKNKKYRFQVFSTRAAAIQWLEGIVV